MEEAWLLVKIPLHIQTIHSARSTRDMGKTYFGRVLPRHYQLVIEINRRFQEEVRTRFPEDEDKVSRMSIVADGQVKMAFLSVVASRSVNGVAALHTKLLKRNLLSDFADIYPERFNNKTNGITPRRWLLGCNPDLSKLIDQTVSSGWKTDLNKLRELEKYASDESFLAGIYVIKRENKKSFVRWFKKLNLEIDPDAIFDSQIKRLHEYKRQHLNLLHILTLYRRLLHNPDLDISKRVLFSEPKLLLDII